MKAKCVDERTTNLIQHYINDIYSCGSQTEVIITTLKSMICDKYVIKAIIDEFNFDVNYNNDELITYYTQRTMHYESSRVIKIIHMLLDYGANPRAGDDAVFIYACRFGNYKLVKRLLDMGVCVNVREGYALNAAGRF